MMALAGGVDAQSTADSASVRAFYGEWMGTGVRGGPASYASYYATDGRILPPNAQPVTGRDAIAEWMRRAQAESQYTTRPTGITSDEMRFLTSDWVVFRSTLRGERVPKAGGEATPFETKYFDLLHRRSSSKWEVVYRMWSDNLP